MMRGFLIGCNKFDCIHRCKRVKMVNGTKVYSCKLNYYPLIKDGKCVDYQKVEYTKELLQVPCVEA